MKVTHSLCRVYYAIVIHVCMHVYIAGIYSVAACLDFGMGELATHYNGYTSYIASTDMHVSSPFANCIFHKYIYYTLSES